MLTYISLGLVFVMACSGEKENDHVTQKSFSRLDENNVVITPEQVSVLNLEFGKFQYRNMTDVIRANGFLDVPPQNKAVISPMITGYVRKTNFIVGEFVKKGQIMAELESMEFIDLQQQFMELQAKTLYLKVELDRQKLLREQDAISKKKYLMAEVDYKTATSTLDGLKSKLMLLGLDFDNLDQGEIKSVFLLKAPISGSVVMQNAMIGKHVDPSEEIYKIVDPEHLHLELNVFEKDVIKLRKEQKVIFKIPSLRKMAFHGEVFLIGKDLSEDKRSINVHVHLDEEEGKFEVGMYANATIEIAENPASSLPVAAVVADGNKKYIFIKTETPSGDLSFSKSQVTTGIESEGFIEILNKNDLTTDEEIVVDGAFYLLAAFSGTD